MAYMAQVQVSKEDFLALSDLAGNMSIMDYMSKVIHEHVAAQQSEQAARCYCGGEYYTDKVFGVVCCRCQAPKQV